MTQVLAVAGDLKGLSKYYALEVYAKDKMF